MGGRNMRANSERMRCSKLRQVNCPGARDRAGVARPHEEIVMPGEPQPQVIVLAVAECSAVAAGGITASRRMRTVGCAMQLVRSSAGGSPRGRSAS
jgi:hypothetical protein